MVNAEPPRTVDESLRALGKFPDLFKRDQFLVKVVSDAARDAPKRLREVALAASPRLERT